MEKLKFHKRQGECDRKNTQPYDYDFKIKIIKEYLNGGISYKALGEKYQVNERLIHYWVHRYNGKRRPYEELKVNPKRAKLNKFTAIKNYRENEDRLKKEEVSKEALKMALQEAELKNKALETMIDIAEKELNISIRKKSGSKQSSR